MLGAALLCNVLRQRHSGSESDARVSLLAGDFKSAQAADEASKQRQRTLEEDRELQETDASDAQRTSLALAEGEKIFEADKMARARAEFDADPRAAVAARKADAPPEVRTVLDDVDSLVNNERKLKDVSRVVATWLVDAHAKAHMDPATKRLARLVLGVLDFTTNMEFACVWKHPYKAGLRAKLQELGVPLREAFVRDRLRDELGNLNLPKHKFVQADVALTSDIVVPLPADFELHDSTKRAVRQHCERVYMHVLLMLASVLNVQFHAEMRKTLGPHVVPSEGVMAKDKDDNWRLTPAKGFARMECKRLDPSDHSCKPGCRPALNVDVLRIIGVCQTPADLKAALEAMNKRFGGCGRVKNGFADDDASLNFELRTIMVNLIMDFGCTFSQLAARDGVIGCWEQHILSVAGGAPRQRWHDEAAQAMAILRSAEFAEKPVMFICEAQMLLDDAYQKRKATHELYKGHRAGSGKLLYIDMESETMKVQQAEQFETDGDSPLKKACRDGRAADAKRLMGAALAAATAIGGHSDEGSDEWSDCEEEQEQTRAPVHLTDLAVGDTVKAFSEYGGGGWYDAVIVSADCATPQLYGVRYDLDGKEEEKRRANIIASQADGDCYLREAFVVACARGRVSLLGHVPELGQGARLRHQRVWTTAWERAASEREMDVGVVKALLAVAAGLPGGVDSCGHMDGVTALMHVTGGGHLVAVQHLLNAGANVDLAANNGSTPLLEGARNGHSNIVAYLLDKGAVVDRARSDGCTPLFLAAQNGHDEVVAQLLSAGAVVDQAIPDGTSPLHMAAQQGHEPVIERLLEKGADVHEVDSKGNTPLDLAEENDHHGVIEQLEWAEMV